MFKKLAFLKKINRLGYWTVPVISVASFMPIVAGQWFVNDSAPASQPLKPLPSPPSVASTSAASLLSPSLLKSPQPKVGNPAKVSQPIGTKEKQDRKATPTTKAKSTAATIPASYKSSSSVPAPPSYSPPPIEIKVAILKDVAGTTLGVSTPASLTDGNGRFLQTLGTNQGVWVQPNSASLTVGNWQLPSAVWVQPSNGGLVYVGDRWYRGKVLLVSQGNTLLAVNYVDFEHYLYSVVGSEMHANAPTEALKAQAIAARSYALVHIIRPASSWYHLGNTQRWQVYKGLASEYNTSQQAVEETAGQVLSYKGGVVESLYAATDEIVSRVHGGRGMSQTGAYELAKQGLDYQRILNYYYPGVGLARLVLQ
jgi:peptidoglycan hydrolase-like amidase